MIDSPDNGTKVIQLEKHVGRLSVSGSWTEDIPEIDHAIVQLKKSGVVEYAGNLLINTIDKTVSGGIDNIYPDTYELYIVVDNSSDVVLFDGSQLIDIQRGDNIADVTLEVKTGSLAININGDVTAPEILTGPDVNISGTDATITWATGDGTLGEEATSNVCYSEIQGFDYQIQTSWAPVGRDLIADNISHSVTISGLTDGDTYYYVVVSSDATGNMRVSSEGSFVVSDGIPGLVAEWLFDGDASDTSGNNNHGIVIGAALTTDRFGNANKAYDYDITGDTIYVNSYASLDFSSTQEFSFGAWVKRRNIKTTILVIQDTAPGFTYKLAIENTDEEIFAGVWEPGSWHWLDTSTVVPLNQWHYIFMTINNTKLTLYMDAVFVAETNLSNVSWNYNTVPVSIGGLSGPPYQTLDGAIDDVRIYNRVLSEDEIQVLYEEGGWPYYKVDSWNTTAPFNTGRHDHTSIVHNEYLYVIGGVDGGAHNDVQYAKFNSDGTVGTWSTTISFTTARYAHTSVVYNGYLYVIGGYNGSNLNDVQYAKINTDGTIGTWSTTTSLTTARCQHVSVIYNGYLYVIGGENPVGYFSNDVQYAKINSDGTVGTWSATTSFTTGRSDHTSVVHNGYLYVIGGGISEWGWLNDVQYAKINSDGTIGTWSATTSFTTARKMHESVIYNGYLYVIGGYGNSDVQYAKINSDGTIGTWSTTTPLTSTRGAHTSVVRNGYLYVIGGYDGSMLNDVQYAPFIP